MVFNSVDYLLFFPVVCIGYFLLPQKLKNGWLLIASFLFYMNWNAAYGLLLAASVLITYAAGIFMKKARDASGKKAVLFASLFLNLGLLVWFKYSGFLAENINRLLHFSGKEIPVPDILLPVGISFYIFQAVGYTADVYYGKIEPETNLLRYALFVSFFPQLVAGPIERSTNLLPQFYEKHTFDPDRIRSGLLSMLWGLFIKMVIADRISLIVTPIFGEYLAYSGLELFLAVVLFTIQIYCDFAGYSYIAIGSARVLGFRLMDNFRQPYLSSSIHNHWKRWHISLTNWFRDYLYIPLGGSRRGKWIKYRNVLIIFLVSGLWHGAKWTYVLWGLLHGFYMLIEEMGAGLKEKLLSAFSLRKENILPRVVGGGITFGLILFGFLIFRSESLGQAVGILRQMKANPLPDAGIAAALSHLCELATMDKVCIAAFLFSGLLLLSRDIAEYRGIRVRELVLTRQKAVRWLVYLVLFFLILVFGIYGRDYTQTEFIYFQF